MAGDTSPEAYGEPVKATLVCCWHCLDVLEPEPWPHCQACPAKNDCDVEGCTAPGCQGERHPTADDWLEQADVLLRGALAIIEGISPRLDPLKVAEQIRGHLAR